MDLVLMSEDRTEVLELVYEKIENWSLVPDSVPAKQLLEHILECIRTVRICQGRKAAYPAEKWLYDNGIFANDLPIVPTKDDTYPQEGITLD